jgi:hypothetical protein
VDVIEVAAPPPSMATPELAAATAAAAAAAEAPPTGDGAEIAMLREQVSNLTAQLAQMAQMMTSGGKLGAAAFAQPALTHMPYPVPLPGMPPGYPMQPGVYNGGPAPMYPEGTYYVRIKPYDKARKQVRRRQFFHELGRCLNGGTGQPGDIPEWIEVEAPVAAALSKYMQFPNDPMSPMVLDIVTPEQRAEIDAAESQVRAQTLGLAGMPPQQVLSAMHRPGMVAAHVGHAAHRFYPNQGVPQPPAPQPPPPPSLMAGVAEHQQATAALAAAQGQPAPVQPMAAPAAQPQRNIAPARAGRAAALQGQPATAAPQVAVEPVGERGVSEDLTGEAIANREIGETIKAVQPHVEGRAGTVRPR